MKFYLTDTKEIKEITLREWNDSSRRYGPDCFSDLETSIPQEYPLYKDEDEDVYDCYCMTSADYNEIVQWWQDEVDSMNARERGDTVDYSDSCVGEMTLFYN